VRLFPLAVVEREARTPFRQLFAGASAIDRKPQLLAEAGRLSRLGWAFA